MSLRLPLIGALGTLLSACLALPWLAAPRFDLPWWSATSVELDAEGFRANPGSGASTGHGLRVTGADLGGRTVLIHAGLDLDVSRLHYLSFGFARLPPTLRPVLIWNGPAGQGSAALPWGLAGGTVELRRLAGWPERLDWLGLLLVPMDAVPTAAVAERAFVFHGMTLSSASRASATSALWTELLAYRPWTGRSINTGGFELPIERRVRPLAWLSISLAGGLLAMAASAAARRRWKPILLAAVLLLWVMLDLLQVRQLLMRAEAAALARGGTPPGHLVTAQPALATPVFELLQRLAAVPADARVLVYGEGAFLGPYSVFLLRDRDAGLLRNLAHLPPALIAQAPVLVLVGSGPWRFESATGTLHLPDQVLAAEPVFEHPTLSAYRLGAPQ